jgi:hypothetical protein
VIAVAARGETELEEDHFEEPILELERRIEALPGVGDDPGTERQRAELQKQLDTLRKRSDELHRQSAFTG